MAFYPGVFFKEVEFAGASRPITGIDMSIGGCVIYAEKGPIGDATLCLSYEEVVDKFGSNIQDSYGMYNIEGFFKNGGQSLYIIRTCHYTTITDASTASAVDSKLTVKDTATSPVDTLDILAKSPGTWGDKIAVKIEDDGFSTTASAVAEIGATEIVVNALSSTTTYVGQIITIGDVAYRVKSFDVATKKIVLTTPLTIAVAISDVVKSYEFKIKVYYNGSLVETFSKLTMVDTLDNYVGIKLGKVTGRSKYIYVVDKQSVSVPAFVKTTPAVIDVTYLTGGNNGLAGVTATDLIGSSASKTGLYAFDYVYDAMNIFIPESQDADVNKGILAYAELRMDCFGVITVPESTDRDGALTYRYDVGNFNSSYGALYYQWGNVSDPIGLGVKPEKLVPLVGHIAGMYARNDRTLGLHESPAGEQAVLLGVNSLEFKIDDNDNAVLNDSNINCIRSLRGAGIVVWGTRTLSADAKWRYIHARRMFIYAEKSIALGTRWSVFRPTTNSTWQGIVRSVTAFLSSMNGLVGATKEERFAVICDSTNNTQEVRDAGQIKCKIGLNISGVGEFLMFEIGQMKEGVTITE